MKLACADFTWPLLSHERALEVIRLLDIEGLDLGIFGNRSHVRPEIVRDDIPMWAGILKERIAGAGLELADFFFQPWTDFTVLTVNHPDPKQQDEARAIWIDQIMPLATDKAYPYAINWGPARPGHGHKTAGCYPKDLESRKW